MFRILHALSVVILGAGVLVLAASCGGVAGLTGMGESAEAYFDSDCEVELAKGIERGDLDAMRRAISDGASVNARGREGMTPIFWALIHQEPEALELLLQENADPNTVTRWVAHGEDRTEDRTARAMELALMLPDTVCLSLLLRYGGDPNAPAGEIADTLLHLAIERAAFDSVRLLVEAGADVNRKGTAEITPVLEAVLGKRFEMAQYLVRNGADPAIANVKGLTPAWLVRQYADRGVAPDSPDHHAFEEFRSELLKRGLLEN